MGSFTFCLVRTAPINATIIINDRGSILSAATLGWLDGVGEYVPEGPSPTLFREPASSSPLWNPLEQSRGWPECVGFFPFKSQGSAPGAPSRGGGRSQALVCCVKLLNEAWQKPGEDRPPSEHGAPGLAPAQSSSPSPLTPHTPHGFSLRFKEVIQPYSIQPSSVLPQDICPSLKDLLLPFARLAPFSYEGSLRGEVLLEPKPIIYLSFKISHFLFLFFAQHLSQILIDLMNGKSHLCLFPPQKCMLYERRDFVSFL